MKPGRLQSAHTGIKIHTVETQRGPRVVYAGRRRQEGRNLSFRPVVTSRDKDRNGISVPDAPVVLHKGKGGAPAGFTSPAAMTSASTPTWPASSGWITRAAI